jgi:hypothetical protein
MSIQASRTIVGVVVVAIVIAIFWYMRRDTSYVNIATFEECASAGYPVMETFPEQCRTPDGRTFTATSVPPVATTTATSTGVASFPSDNSDRIRVTNVSANQQVASPFTVEGTARGNWYFEASFPIELRDGNGKLIVQKPAQAIGEWMTVEFVPFSATLTYAKPATATGTLILRNDNPSGLPENDRWISIPVRF